MLIVYNVTLLGVDLTQHWCPRRSTLSGVNLTPHMVLKIFSVTCYIKAGVVAAEFVSFPFKH